MDDLASSPVGPSEETRLTSTYLAKRVPATLTFSPTSLLAASRASKTYLVGFSNSRIFVSAEGFWYLKVPPANPPYVGFSLETFASLNRFSMTLSAFWKSWISVPTNRFFQLRWTSVM